MQLRQLGRTDIELSPLILGTWAIGGWMWGGANEKDSIAAIHASLDRGINTLDTAAIYGMGYSEEVIKKATVGRRDRIIIATKCGMRWNSNEGADPWPQKDLQGKSVMILNNSRPDSIFYECEQSLKRLGVEVIDLYQIHWPDPSTPIEQSWEAMVKLKQQGKVRAIGVSNYSLEQLKQAHAVHPVDSIQPPYSLLRRNIEEDVLPFCKENKISVLVYSPLERGLLTGKVALDRQFPKGDHREGHDTFSQKHRQNALEALENIRPIAEKHHATFSQIVLHCTINIPGITSAIVGARNAQQAFENADTLQLNLSNEERHFVVSVLTPALLE
jgi:methylglyoxal reductase